MKTLTRAELKRGGVTREMAEQWREISIVARWNGQGILPLPDESS